MPIDFKRIEKTVKKTIRDLGEKQTVTLQAPGAGFFDPARPYEGPADGGTTYTVEAVVTPWRKDQNPVGVDISQADFTVYISGSSLTVQPAIGWLCILDTVEYKIVGVTRTRPGSTTLLWTLVVER